MSGCLRRCVVRSSLRAERRAESADTSEERERRASPKGDGGRLLLCGVELATHLCGSERKRRSLFCLRGCCCCSLLLERCGSRHCDREGRSVSRQHRRGIHTPHRGDAALGASRTIRVEAPLLAAGSAETPAQAATTTRGGIQRAAPRNLARISRCFPSSSRCLCCIVCCVA